MPVCPMRVGHSRTLPIAIWQLKFLIIGINYFIKWVEVEPLATIMEKNVRSFF